MTMATPTTAHQRPADALEQRAIAALSEEMHAQLAALNVKMNAQLTALNVKMNARIAELEAELAAASSELLALRMKTSSGRELLKMLRGRVSARLRRTVGSSSPAAGGVAGGVAGAAIDLPTEAALRRARARGVEIASIIDIGASDGSWTEMCRRVYPEARAILLDANDVHRASLERYVASRQGVEHKIAAVGPACCDLWFERTPDPFGGRIHSERLKPEWEPLPGTTIDHEVATRGLAGPYLVKLDTHGFEVPILEGAQETLKNAQLLVVECYPFKIGDGALMFHEFCAWMWERGFMALDITEPLWRARDGCLWQIDIIFSPRTRPECQVDSWT
jgi:FkbM family methyltransferase